VSLPEVVVGPGAVITVEISLDDAAGLRDHYKPGARNSKQLAQLSSPLVS
jgi:hypothetical protein